MIRSFRDKGLQRLAERGDPSKLSVQNVARVERILSRLDTISTPEDANLPAGGSTLSPATRRADTRCW